MKAKRTGETYSCALNGFLKSCSKTYLEDIRVDDLENFQVRLRSQGQSDRTAANRVGQVVTFLRKHGIQNVSIRPGYLRKKVLPYSDDDLGVCSKPQPTTKSFCFHFFWVQAHVNKRPRSRLTPTSISRISCSWFVRNLIWVSCRRTGKKGQCLFLTS